MTGMVSPLDYRYGRDEVKRIFTEEHRFELMLEVELAICQAEEELNLIPSGISEKVRAALNSGKVKLSRAKEIEAEIRHDVMAVVKAMSEAIPDAAPYIHVGATSQDVSDTVTAVQLRDFLPILIGDLLNLQSTISGLVSRYRDTIMVGRTHGQHASPITFGLKMAVYLSEINRHLERLIESGKRFLVGKFMGPVGTGGFIGEQSLKLQEKIMSGLRLNPESNPTQLVNRDRYLELLSIIAMITVTLEKLFTEIRNLQRPEIGEVAESFDPKSQVGSSSMPSKTNPIDSENICSLSRLTRSFILPEYESSIQWHERDLTNSASERFVIPYTCILIDHVCFKSNGVLRKLRVHEDRMKANIASDDLSMSEAIVNFLWKRGMSRQDAHEIVREAAMKSIESGSTFRDALTVSFVKHGISREGLQKAFEPAEFLGASVQICSATIKASEETAKKAKKYIEGTGWII